MLVNIHIWLNDTSRIALWAPLAGMLFDFFDGKVARWRNESSMLGQELDSLADSVRGKKSSGIVFSDRLIVNTIAPVF